MPRINSLPGFEKLEIVELPAPILNGFENNLPDENGNFHPHYSETQVRDFVAALLQTLKRLTILDCSTAIFDCISAMFPWGRAPPSLKTIRLFLPSNSATEPYDRLGSHWEEMALKAGVLLTRATNDKSYMLNFWDP